MKPFNNIAVSPIEPENKADVWIQHSKNIFNSSLEKGIINFQTGALESSSDAVRTTNYIPVEPNVEYTINRVNGTGTKAFAIRGYDSNFNYLGYISTFTENIKTFKTVTANIDGMPSKNTAFSYMKFVDYDNNINAKYMINKGNKSLSYEHYVEDDILVNDNGVYNSVLNRKNAISLGIKEQVNITQQGLRILVPMDNLSVKVGETFELLSDGTIKILKNTIIFAFAQTQLIINDTDTGRLYIEKNGDGICAEEGKGTKAYQAMGIFNVNVGDIIRVTVVNVTAGRGNTGTTVSFNHLDMYEI